MSLEDKAKEMEQAAAELRERIDRKNALADSISALREAQEQTLKALTTPRVSEIIRDPETNKVIGIRSVVQSEEF